MKLLNTTRALGCKNTKELDEFLATATHDVLGWSRADFNVRWRPTRTLDMTNRPRFAPMAEALWDRWQQDRDVKWLYSHPEYFMLPLTGSTLGKTRDNLRAAMTWLVERPPKVIVDFGAGCGVTTVCWAVNFPDSIVHYVEVSEQSQRLCAYFAARVGVDNIRFGPPDEHGFLLSALEVTEHLWGGESRVGNPLATGSLFTQLLSGAESLLHASQWASEVSGWHPLGHFLRYRIGDEVVPCMRARGAFEREVEKRGFEKINTGWNKQPALFRRKTT